MKIGDAGGEIAMVMRGDLVLRAIGGLLGVCLGVMAGFWSLGYGIDKGVKWGCVGDDGGGGVIVTWGLGMR